MKTLGIIPSRYASTRFPGKPLIDIAGKSMIQRVYEQALESIHLDKVVVATDDERILHHVELFGGEVVMTSEDHQNGTSRCQQTLKELNLKSKDYQFDAVVNIQGDEPFIDPAQIDKVAVLLSDKKAEIATLVKLIEDEEELFNPNVVKVVFDEAKKAKYFSRQTIPYVRDVLKNDWLNRYAFYKHLGIYGYRSKVLTLITKLKESPLEKAEKLEQLRWLENGFEIHIDITTMQSIAIDTPEDLSKLTNTL